MSLYLNIEREKGCNCGGEKKEIFQECMPGYPLCKCIYMDVIISKSEKLDVTSCNHNIQIN
jgi:hypothetical protein